MRYRRAAFLLIAGAAACLAVAVAWRVPLTAPTANYAAAAQEWGRNGSIGNTFTPLFDAMLLGIAERLAGMRGVELLHGLVHVALGITGLALLRRLRVPEAQAMAVALLLLVFPDLLTSVVKIWDVALTTELLLLLLLLCVVLLEERSAPWVGKTALLVAASVLFGTALSLRPNVLLLAPAILYASVSPLRGFAAKAVAMLAFCAMGAAVFAGLAVAEHGSFFVAGNGPYNLFAGHNPWSAWSLEQTLNGEQSILKAVRDHEVSAGLPVSIEQLQTPALNPLYLRWSREFAFSHPAEETRLLALKFFTFFRPDTKAHALRTPAGLVKALFALPAVLYAMALVRRRAELDGTDWFLLSWSLLYLLPFLATNADPRFRTPLDAVMLIAAARLVWARSPTVHFGGKEKRPGSLRAAA